MDASTLEAMPPTGAQREALSSRISRGSIVSFVSANRTKVSIRSDSSALQVVTSHPVIETLKAGFSQRQVIFERLPQLTGGPSPSGMQVCLKV